MVDIEKEIPQLDQVPTVREFIDDFSNDLPGLPLYREIEFCVDLVLCTKLISMALYRMMLAKLRELRETTARFVEQRVYSIECVFLGSSSVVCQKE